MPLRHFRGHQEQHGEGGSDEISEGSLLPQDPTEHGNDHAEGGSDEIDSPLPPEAYPLNYGSTRPSAGIDGRQFWVSDDEILWLDKGDAWSKIGVVRHPNLKLVSKDDHHDMPISGKDLGSHDMSKHDDIDQELKEESDVIFNKIAVPHDDFEGNFMGLLGTHTSGGQGSPKTDHIMDYQISLRNHSNLSDEYLSKIGFAASDSGEGLMTASSAIASKRTDSWGVGNLEFWVKTESTREGELEEVLELKDDADAEFKNDLQVLGEIQESGTPVTLAETGAKRLFVQPDEPSNAEDGDVWFVI